MLYFANYVAMAEIQKDIYDNTLLFYVKPREERGLSLPLIWNMFLDYP